MQKYDAKSVKLLFIGKSGSGKTTLAWKLFLQRKARLKFIYDHKAMEFSLRYGIPPCFTKEEMVEAIKSGRQIICFCPMKTFPGEPERGFEVFCKFVFNISEVVPGVILLMADELQRLVGIYARPKPLLNICDIGRTYEIECYFIASASNTIHNLVRGQITEVYCFTHSGDCKWEVENGFDETAIRTIKKGVYVRRNIDTGETDTGGNPIP
jgi:GTPase SAR1 family protein